MAANIIDGKPVKCLRKVSNEVRIKDRSGITPGLTVILVGNDPLRQYMSEIKKGLAGR